jgi:hypothetical protein
VRLEVLRQLKKIHLIGTRTDNLPACSLVPQPTTLPLAPPPDVFGRREICLLTLRHSRILLQIALNLWLSILKKSYHRELVWYISFLQFCLPSHKQPSGTYVCKFKSFFKCKERSPYHATSQVPAQIPSLKSEDAICAAPSGLSHMSGASDRYILSRVRGPVTNNFGF